ASVADAVRAALRAERLRSAIANRVFSLSLVVLAGLLAFLAVRRSGAARRSLGTWLEAHGNRVPSLKVGGVEVVGTSTSRSAVAAVLSVALGVLQALVIYAWLAFS